MLRFLCSCLVLWWLQGIVNISNTSLTENKSMSSTKILHSLCRLWILHWSSCWDLLPHGALRLILVTGWRTHLRLRCWWLYMALCLTCSRAVNKVAGISLTSQAERALQRWINIDNLSVMYLWNSFWFYHLCQGLRPSTLSLVFVFLFSYVTLKGC